ncbi:exodeoxyribonuclease III [Basilea psittacipulmonis]|uniref:Exodeoxyribonuclease III n=1 Tax=Basilea psittacipulmonis DSM 24701 TaxID=1072685 RepID=A0A077DDC8_9BURK|nr:exodeoxyribonuclease III [Basilea psittacipulmonis]AIL32840.1 exodeoxyribonuclease III [Basilea psittacipulmonis DSM 24701]
MKLATWNVNSLKVRLEQVLAWLDESECDVLCLQELKMDTPLFPQERFEEKGFHCAWIGQKTYNGVAIISRYPLSDIIYNNPYFEDTQKRLVTATVSAPIGNVRVICAYCPNGSDIESEKYHYKLSWFKALNHWVAEQLQQHPKLVLNGDFNIAPQDQDIHSGYKGPILISEAERMAFQHLLDLGLHDAFRLFEQEEKSFSWWDYRMMSFRRNAGLRIDHILISQSLVNECHACVIDKAPRKNEKPSDHTPVVATFLS